MKICFLIIATNKYIQFVEPLIQSIEQYALVEHDRHYLVFTDQQTNFDNPRIHVERITHQPWPAPSLMRYHYFLQKKDWIEGHDYCFYIDADMRVVAPVAEKILGDIVAVLHPGFWKKKRKKFTYERNPLSTAYVPPEKGTRYYCGGVQGGKSKCYMVVARAIADAVDIDTSNGIVAKWHDESHWNRYLSDYPPTLVMSPSYCYPDCAIKNTKQWELQDLPPLVLALSKDHSEMRDVPVTMTETLKKIKHKIFLGVKKLLF